jgi:hypothetical protein
MNPFTKFDISEACISAALLSSEARDGVANRDDSRDKPVVAHGWLSRKPSFVKRKTCR